MNSLDYWRLCDDFNVFQIALLMLGYEPSSAKIYDCERTTSPPDGYEPICNALKNAFRSNRLNGCVGYRDDDLEIDWYATTISVEDVREWLRSRGTRNKNCTYSLMTRSFLKRSLKAAKPH